MRLPARRPGEDRPHAQHHLGGTERLDDVVVRTEGQAVDAVGHRAAGAEHDDGHGVRRRARSREHVEPVDVGQPEIQQDEVDVADGEQMERLGSAAGGEHAVTGALEVATQDVADVAVVLDDEHRAHAHHPPTWNVERNGTRVVLHPASTPTPRPLRTAA